MFRDEVQEVNIFSVDLLSNFNESQGERAWREERLAELALDGGGEFDETFSRTFCFGDEGSKSYTFTEIDLMETGDVSKSTLDDVLQDTV